MGHDLTGEIFFSGWSLSRGVKSLASAGCSKGKKDPLRFKEAFRLRESGPIDGPQKSDETSQSECSYERSVAA
jgi:hypothetical protein